MILTKLETFAGLVACLEQVGSDYVWTVSVHGHRWGMGIHADRAECETAYWEAVRRIAAEIAPC